MLGDQWLFVTVAGVFLVQLALLLAFVRRLNDGHDGDDAASARAVCQECGTVNSTDFHFCRECVARLPDGGRVPTATGSPLDRQV